MIVQNPPNVNLSQLLIDADLVMGAHNVTLGAGQTVDGKDVSTLDIGNMTKAIYDAGNRGIVDIAQIVSLLLGNGITPTIPAAWSTDPTNLGNITNIDLTDYTGTGIVAATGDNKNIEIDLKANCYVKNILTKMHINDDYFRVYIGTTAPAYTGGTPNNMTLKSGNETGTAEIDTTIEAAARYIVIMFHSAAAANDYSIQYVDARGY